MEYIKQLTEIGFTEKEARIYMASLELGSSSIQNIASKTGLKRSTVYDIVDKLIGKGLINLVGDGKRRLFSAENPQKIRQMLKTKEMAFGQLMPNLLSLYNLHETKPRIRFYEGKRGLETIWWDIINSKRTILAYSSVDALHGALSPAFIDTIVKERVKRGIYAKVIISDTPLARKYAQKNKETKREYRFVSQDLFPFTNDINICDNFITISSLSEKFGLIIESKKIAEMQRAIFELAWMGANQL